MVLPKTTDLLTPFYMVGTGNIKMMEHIVVVGNTKLIEYNMMVGNTK